MFLWSTKEIYHITASPDLLKHPVIVHPSPSSVSLVQAKVDWDVKQQPQMHFSAMFALLAHCSVDIKQSSVLKNNQTAMYKSMSLTNDLMNL